MGPGDPHRHIRPARLRNPSTDPGDPQSRPVPSAEFLLLLLLLFLLFLFPSARDAAAPNHYSRTRRQL